jgi:hypothetical protein
MAGQLKESNACDYVIIDCRYTECLERHLLQIHENLIYMNGQFYGQNHDNILLKTSGLNYHDTIVFSCHTLEGASKLVQRIKELKHCSNFNNPYEYTIKENPQGIRYLILRFDTKSC